uniref:Fibronectin type-III domain-containing protein n=1 Tax=Denticeps clupeoides TaxID=299321 RepID=A0AAY4DUB1_9TELE
SFSSHHCLLHVPSRCAKIEPDSSHPIPVEIGKEFTAVCVLRHTDFTADDIVWMNKTSPLPNKYYTKVNNSASSITFNVTKGNDWTLTCSARRQSYQHFSPCIYGIMLRIGYPPEKPKNLTCWSVQNCTNCPLSSDVHLFFFSSFSPLLSSGKQIKNVLGRVASEELSGDSDILVKTNPPTVNVSSEKAFPQSLIIFWTPPIEETYVRLKYNIRFCEVGSAVWNEVPTNEIQDHAISFRLQSLKPYTQYVVQMRCKSREDLGFWSDWSSNFTACTSEQKPSSEPDMWLSTTVSGDQRQVTLMLKEPVESNGKILGFNLTVIDGQESQRLWVHRFTDRLFQNVTFTVQSQSEIVVKVVAVNSAGESPKASLILPTIRQGLPPVKSLAWSTLDNKLLVEWEKPYQRIPLEYVIEWVSFSVPNCRDWQREPRSDLQPFVRYNVTVTPVYRKSRPNKELGEPSTVAVYLKQGVPKVGPSIKPMKVLKTSIELVWENIPLQDLNGFVTRYTVFYESADTSGSLTVEPHTQSCILKNLTSLQKYKLWAMVSTEAGSRNGSVSYVSTPKYNPGEVEMIVVFVCIGFLFFIIFVTLLCFNKREIIKMKLWPQVPDPSNSSAVQWPLEFGTRADTPKETTLGDVSVVEVDMLDRKSLCEDDKTSLAQLKKDTYPSEEHSSGIGGSSGMSSPRQSVSDSDDADSGQTTGSTVQYSSVVSGSGYKGQTPNSAQPTFARSESTQPLLECEEQSPQEGSVQSGGSSKSCSYFRRHHAESSGSNLLKLCPAEIDEQDSTEFRSAEDGEQLAALEPPQNPSYMPQQSGYRPQ